MQAVRRTLDVFRQCVPASSGVLLVLWLLARSAQAQEPCAVASVAPLIEVQVEAGEHVAPDLAAFYRERAFAPVWMEGAHPSARALAWMQVVSAAEDEGLSPEAYHAEALARLLAAESNGPTPDACARLDVLLSDAVLRFGTALLKGRVEPVSIHGGWTLPSREADGRVLLEAAARADDVAAVVAQWEPPYPRYALLRQALQRYRRIAEAGGWPALPDGPTLEPGDRDLQVRTLRRRLLVTGERRADPADSSPDSADVFDDALVQAVRVFQERHGLDVDGRVGRQTRAALNVSAEARVRQIALSMERWRWLPADLGPRYLLVNLAGCMLDVFEGGRSVLHMRVICGTRSDPTPVFSAALTELVLAPFWNVPYSIATREILPALRTDPGYLARHHMTLFRDGRVVHPASVDWSKVSARSFPYWIRQDPGPTNPLGRLKFVLPNPFGIRLHDTSQPYLFLHNACTFSHGCLRVQKPLDLAVYAMRGDTTWTRDRIVETIERWVETTIALPAPIPIHVLYWTAWVDEQGALHFRDDVYRYDALLQQALDRAAALEGGGAGTPQKP